MNECQKSDLGGAHLLHGGRLQAARLRFPDAPQPWIDLSTGINPWPYPLPELTPDIWARLPEPEEIAALEQAAADYFGVADAACVIATPGSDLAMRLLPSHLLAQRVAIVGPTYGGHREAWFGRAVVEVTREGLGQAVAHVDAAVVVDPNNPDGTILSQDALDDARVGLAARGGVLIVDEAFADTIPGGLLERYGGALPPGLILLRSFGKYFGLGGLRLGFVIAGEPLAGALRHVLGAWPVSGPAAVIGTAAYRDHRWIAATRIRLRAAAEALDRLLSEAGLGVIGGTPLFRLVERDGAITLADHLGRNGILVRSFPDRPRLLRLGLPADQWASARLLDALKSWEIRQ